MCDIDPTLYIFSSNQDFSNLVLDRGRGRPREEELVLDRRRTNRLIKKLKLVKYCWMKLVCHNGPNHPAKYGCLGVSSYKVGFSLVNRVSLIFKLDNTRRARVAPLGTIA